jgi:hypothetical protein
MCHLGLRIALSALAAFPKVNHHSTPQPEHRSMIG